MTIPPIQQLLERALDVTAPDHIEIEVQERPNGLVLYVHVDGVTLFRACRIKRIKGKGIPPNYAG